MRNFTKAGLDKHRVKVGPLASTEAQGNHGAFTVKFKEFNETTFLIIASEGIPGDYPWEHVSVHCSDVIDGADIDRTPNWEEMCRIKDLFWSPSETVIQFHPQEATYVNIHPHVLHLWKKIGVDHELPPSFMV